MPHNKADTDGSIPLPWIVAIGYDNDILFTFLTSAGAAFDVTGYVFSLQIRKPGAAITDTLFDFTESNYVTNNGAAGTVSVSGLNYVRSALLKNRGEYFWNLSVVFPSGTRRRWFNGKILASSELHENTVTSTDPITISTESFNITATVSLNGGSSGDINTGSVDNALLRADGTGGATIQGSPIVVTDTGDIEIGAGQAGGNRTIQYTGTETDVGLIEINKGTSDRLSLFRRYFFTLRDSAGGNSGAGIQIYDAEGVAVGIIGLKADGPLLITAELGAAVQPIRILSDDDYEFSDAFYLGPKNTNGTWRFFKSGDNLLIQQREAGSYVTKSTITG